MTPTEWQRNNYLFTIERLLPSWDDALLSVSTMSLHGGGHLFSDLPLNPWLDLFEILALGCKHRAISQTDLSALWQKTGAGSAIPIPDMSSKGATRPLLDLFHELARGVGVELAAANESFVQFPVFVDMHWQFRQSLPRVLFGYSSIGLILSHAEGAGPEELADWLLASDERIEPYYRVGARALFNLRAYLKRTDELYATWPGFKNDLVVLYRPWGAVVRWVESVLQRFEQVLQHYQTEA